MIIWNAECWDNVITIYITGMGQTRGGGGVECQEGNKYVASSFFFFFFFSFFLFSSSSFWCGFLVLRVCAVADP